MTEANGTGDGRVLPQHFNRDGSIKRKYRTLTEAVYAAGNVLTNDPDRPMQAYPCYCEAFHIGRARPGQRADYVTDLEAVRWALTSMGYRRTTDHVWPDGHVAERWGPVDRPLETAGIFAIWCGLYGRAEVDARRLRAERHAVPVEPRRYGDDEKRLFLENGGWRRIDNPDRERWLAPGKSRKKSKGKPLNVAFAKYTEQAAAIARRRRTDRARIPVRTVT